MDYPFKIIESKMGRRNEFELTDGTQPTHALFFLKEGNFTLTLDGKVEETITSGDCVIFPDYVHFKRSVSKTIVFVYIKFAAKENSVFPYELPFGKISFKDKERFLSSISALERLLESEDVFYSHYKNHLLNDIILQIISENTPEKTDCHSAILSDKLLCACDSYITQNIHKKMSVYDICRASGTNASTLNHRFRTKLGMSVGMYVNTRRMKKARQLLRSTSYSITEIARRCGFDEVYYFSIAFKKHHGITPSDFRKQ